MNTLLTFDAYLHQTGEVGYVEQVTHSIVDVAGLPGAHLGEMVLFESGQLGQVSMLRSTQIEVLLLSNELVKVGCRVTRLGKKTSITVSEKLLGRAVDVLGRVISGMGTDDINPLEQEVRQIDTTPAGIIKRRKIQKGLHTGVIMIDLMIPLGCGQRELIIGDRKTGKSYFLLQSLLAQAKLGTVCVYAAIGKKKTEIMKIQEFMKEQGILDRSVIVGASSQDSDGEIFLCPYTAMSIAEFFRDKGRDVLLVLDDMSTHAKFYREQSLMSRKFPGRDSYPGDIFHVHSKLLERAGNFVVNDKEVSITCLPVSETIQGDIASYIPTNLMSMTDGHVYFDGELFFRGRRPAVNPFISVTRVGRQTQTKLRRDAGRLLFDMLNNYEKTQSFLKFGAELGENSRQILAMGDRILQFFDQPYNVVVQPNVQVVLLALLVSGQWDGKNMQKMVDKYDVDGEFAKKLDEVVSTSDSMNKLMEECRNKADIFMTVLQ